MESELLSPPILFELLDRSKAAQASDVPDLFRRLEACGQLVRPGQQLLCRGAVRPQRLVQLQGLGVGERGELGRAPEVRCQLGVGLDALKLNPWDIPTLTNLARACEELRYGEAQMDPSPAHASEPRAPGRGAAYFDTTLTLFDWHGANDVVPANCIRK